MIAFGCNWIAKVMGFEGRSSVAVSNSRIVLPGKIPQFEIGELFAASWALRPNLKPGPLSTHPLAPLKNAHVIGIAGVWLWSSDTFAGAGWKKSFSSK